MKNKVLVLLVVILSILAICNLNVQAEGEGDNPNTDPNGGTDTGDNNGGGQNTQTTWGLDYTTNDYDYTIEGVVLKIYKLDSNNTVTSTNNDNGTTSTVTTNEDSIAYINGVPTKTVNLAKSDYTINPELSKNKLGEINTSFVDLKLDLTKEKLESILEEEINSTTKDISYIIEISLKYKITRYPEKYRYFLNINSLRFLISAFGSPEITYTPETNINETLSQVLNIVIIEKKDENSETKLTFETELNKDNNISSYIFNPLILSEEEIDFASSNNDLIKPDKAEYLLFHNISNIQFLIDNYNTIENDTNNEAQDTIKDTIKDLEVEVPNTSKNKSIVIAMIGTIITLTGVILIAYTIRMRQFLRIRKQETI